MMLGRLSLPWYIYRGAYIAWLVISNHGGIAQQLNKIDPIDWFIETTPAPLEALKVVLHRTMLGVRL